MERDSKLYLAIGHLLTLSDEQLEQEMARLARLSAKSPKEPNRELLEAIRKALRDQHFP